MKKLIKAVILFFVLGLIFRISIAIGAPAILGLVIAFGAAFTSMPILRLWLKDWWNN